jgi:hypothetical protein
MEKMKCNSINRGSSQLFERSERSSRALPKNDLDVVRYEYDLAMRRHARAWEQPSGVMLAKSCKA